MADMISSLWISVFKQEYHKRLFFPMAKKDSGILPEQRKRILLAPSPSSAYNEKESRSFFA